MNSHATRILLKLVLFVAISCSLAAVITKDNEDANTNTADLQTSASSAKLLNLAGLFGYGNTGYYPNYNYNRPTYNPNYNRPTNYPNYGYNTNSGFYPSTGNYPTTSVGGYYPNNNNYYPTTTGTNILGSSGFGYGGYGGYGGNGGLRQYSGYWNPSYTGQRNLGYGYYAHTNTFGLPANTRDSVPYSFRGYN